MDALIISNHGGRVLDGVVSPLEVLPAIAQAVHVPLLLDSGVRWGTDVVKTLAWGQRRAGGATKTARPGLRGLAGGNHMLHLLRGELSWPWRNWGALRWPTLAQTFSGKTAKKSAYRALYKGFNF